jgi:hypothetical protein
MLFRAGIFTTTMFLVLGAEIGTFNPCPFLTSAEHTDSGSPADLHVPGKINYKLDHPAKPNPLLPRLWGNPLCFVDGPARSFCPIRNIHREFVRETLKNPAAGADIG